MLFNIVLLICSSGLARSLKCHKTSDKCQIRFKFDEPLASNAKWWQSCLGPVEEKSCAGQVRIDYVTQVAEVHLINPASALTTDDSAYTMQQLQIDFQKNMNVRIAVVIYCNTKDMCATDIIRPLLPKFNTMKGRSVDIYNALKALLIDPSAQSSDKKGNISCFDIDTNTTARCTAKDARTCTISDAKSQPSVVAGCTDRKNRELWVGYTQEIISQKPEPVNPLSVIYCDRDNCNGLAVHKQVLNLSNNFIEPAYVVNGGHQSSSIFGIGLFFLTLQLTSNRIVSTDRLYLLFKEVY